MFKIPFLAKLKFRIYHVIFKFLFDRGIITKEIREHNGFIFTPKTSPAEIQKFISLIKPVGVNTELIRLGAKTDGGYLVPDDLDGIQACFSPGVDKVSEFEQDCLKKGIKVFMADKSVDTESIDLSNPDSFFIPKYIGHINSDDFISLDSWVDSVKLPANSDLILQMDIEGWEYWSLFSTSEQLLRRFRIIVIEFHNLDRLVNPEFFNLVQACFERLMQNHVCVHIHPNNAESIVKWENIEIPPLLEFTFYRKDRVRDTYQRENFPHELDKDNTDHPTVILPRSWYVDPN